jgi:hypothetical protein
MFLWTRYVEHSYSWEAHSRSVSQDVSRLLWYSQFNFYADKNALLDPALVQICIVLFTSLSRTEVLHISYLTAMHGTHISNPTWFYYPNKMY